MRHPLIAYLFSRHFFEMVRPQGQEVCAKYRSKYYDAIVDAPVFDKSGRVTAYTLFWSWGETTRVKCSDIRLRYRPRQTGKITAGSNAESKMPTALKNLAAYNLSPRTKARNLAPATEKKRKHAAQPNAIKMVSSLQTKMPEPKKLKIESSGGYNIDFVTRLAKLKELYGLKLITQEQFVKKQEDILKAL